MVNFKLDFKRDIRSSSAFHIALSTSRENNLHFKNIEMKLNTTQSLVTKFHQPKAFNSKTKYLETI